jgi:signal transduction histidine kinase
MFGHAMRSPLQTIQITAHHLAKLDVAGDTKALCDGRRTQQTLGNLLENAIK